MLVISACVLRNKITCAMKLDYSAEEVRSVNLTRPHPTVPRGKTQVKTSGVGFGCSG